MRHSQHFALRKIISEEMQALRVSQLSENLSGVHLCEIPTPDRGKGQVLVRVLGASLNFPDLLMTQGRYQFKPELPFTSGLELAGEVLETDRLSRFKKGDKVIGGNKIGAFAEVASIDESSLSVLPESFNCYQGAALGAAYSTAFSGLIELGSLSKDQWVLVTGASGGVASAAIDLCKALGAKVIAATNSVEKVERIRNTHRPDFVILSKGRFREKVREITDGKLCDIVFDPVGGDVFDECTRCVSFAGKLVIVGFASGRIAEIKTNIPLIKGFTIIGLRAGEYSRRFPDRGKAIKEKIAGLASQGMINPAIDRIIPLSRWSEGFQAMKKRELVGKIVFDPTA